MPTVLRPPMTIWLRVQLTSKGGLRVVTKWSNSQRRSKYCVNWAEVTVIRIERKKYIYIYICLFFTCILITNTKNFMVFFYSFYCPSGHDKQDFSAQYLTCPQCWFWPPEEWKRVWGASREASPRTVALPPVPPGPTTASCGQLLASRVLQTPGAPPFCHSPRESGVSGSSWRAAPQLQTLVLLQTRFQGAADRLTAARFPGPLLGVLDLWVVPQPWLVWLRRRCSCPWALWFGLSSASRSLCSWASGRCRRRPQRVWHRRAREAGWFCQGSRMTIPAQKQRMGTRPGPPLSPGGDNETTISKWM